MTFNPTQPTVIRQWKDWATGTWNVPPFGVPFDIAVGAVDNTTRDGRTGSIMLTMVNGYTKATTCVKDW
jgi:hypothetical protein